VFVRGSEHKIFQNLLGFVQNGISDNKKCQAVALPHENVTEKRPCLKREYKIRCQKAAKKVKPVKEAIIHAGNQAAVKRGK
jgi:hypothetical protein